MNTKLANYNQGMRQSCHLTALNQQKANPADPYTYARVMTHLLGGLCPISDYSVEFRTEQRKTATGASYTVQVPFNMKVL